MSSPPRTASQLAAVLVTDFCVPTVKGEGEKEIPVEGVELLPEQRQRLGLPADGLMVAYDLGEAQVFLHMLGPTATVLYTRGDVNKGMSAVDSALKKAHPSLKQQRDIDHPRGGKKRLRVYAGDLAPGRHCTVEVDYPASGAKGDELKCVIRVTAFEREGNKGGRN